MSFENIKKVGVLYRLVAKLIDITILLALYALPLYPANALASFIYCLIADGIKDGQSVGKMVMKLRVMNTITNTPCSFKDSIFRNAPLGIAAFFGIIPIWGWLVLLILGIPLILIEFYLMTSLETGNRLGDILADTKVVSLEEENKS